ncbi:MAG TPA: holo-ACP synthase [Candidatus Polarisedimenticolia bacterium]|jgi:holo-[acyl-carrier protein] synthase|nr:holo-ACP synthase [Candidatus Polarisedimenticolia bacterium]
MILGIGMDLCEVDRIQRLLEKDRERFIRRVFRKEEAAYCEARRRPALHFAARFAAKEAFLKSLGQGWRLGWTQVGVVRGPSGKPDLSLSGKASQAVRSRGVLRIHLTLTHTAGTAAAVVVLEGAPRDAETGGE